MGLEDFIRKLRPNISDTSIKTYCSVLRAFYKRMYPADTHFDTDKFLKDKDRILHTLNDTPMSKRKTLTSAIVVLTNRDPEYRDLMMNDIKATEAETDKQELTDKQRENWLTKKEIEDKTKHAFNEFSLLAKKPSHNAKELQKMQNFIILSLYSGKYVAPRRALDYAVMKTVGDIDEENDNYIDMKQKKFVFNRFKTAKSHGKEQIDIPKELFVYIKKWLLANTSGYFLIDTKNKPLSAITLNQRMNTMFDGRKIGVNAFRKTYLTDKFGEMIPLNRELEKTMKDMGSSDAVATSYIKQVK